VQRDLHEIESHGAGAVAVGQGTGVEAARIARTMKLTFPVLGDPSKEGYRALDLGREGWWALLAKPFLEDPAGALRNLREADLGASLSPRSDVKQLGGVVLVDRAGTIRWLHRSRTTTDVPSTAELLAALDALAAGA